MSDNVFGTLFRGVLITNTKLYYKLDRDEKKFMPEFKEGILLLSDIQCIDIVYPARAPGAIVYDVMNREVVFTAAANELIEYFDDECAVTRIWQSGNKHPFFLHYYDDNKFEKVGEGRYCAFDKERGLLMIFK